MSPGVLPLKERRFIGTSATTLAALSQICHSVRRILGYGWRLKLNEVTVSTPSISTISTTARPPPTLDIPDPRVGAPLYGQCGGTGWTGPDFCQSNYLCIWVNEWYSHCLLPECRDKGPYCQSELEQWGRVLGRIQGVSSNRRIVR
ncbi:hypothetical protein BKA70DRAFT_372070 [Coprinopsis sp. MPI-PUGE-AT-0042]|nr:hypothetical protein BKA70DRAFT_372070 [Coprinopsis sp. MPI-PUGE-AT-0042]